MAFKRDIASLIDAGIDMGLLHSTNLYTQFLCLDTYVNIACVSSWSHLLVPFLMDTSSFCVIQNRGAENNPAVTKADIRTQLQHRVHKKCTFFKNPSNALSYMKQILVSLYAVTQFVLKTTQVQHYASLRLKCNGKGTSVADDGCIDTRKTTS